MQTTKGHAPIQDVLKAAGALATSTPKNSTPSSAEAEAKPLLPTVPDWTTSLTGSAEKERRGRESMHTFRDKGSIQSTTTKASRRRYSIGMMTLEDEEQWMEYRQDSIERLRARKDIRRGITCTSIGSGEQSNWNRQPLEMVISSVITDERDLILLSLAERDWHFKTYPFCFARGIMTIMTDKCISMYLYNHLDKKLL